eukprot:jgi/Mesvir1/10680/Mv13771-RA.1
MHSTMQAHIVAVKPARGHNWHTSATHTTRACKPAASKHAGIKRPTSLPGTSCKSRLIGSHQSEFTGIQVSSKTFSFSNKTPFRCAAVCKLDNGHEPSSPGAPPCTAFTPDKLCRVLTVTTVVLLAFPLPASASKLRRHHTRRLLDPAEANAKSKSGSAGAESSPGSTSEASEGQPITITIDHVAIRKKLEKAVQDARQTAEKAGKTVMSTLSTGARNLPVRASVSPGGRVHLSARRPPIVGLTRAVSWPYLVAAAAVAWLFITQVWGKRSKRSEDEGGQWVADRSLGGKLVRVSKSAAEKIRPPSRWRKSSYSPPKRGVSPLEDAPSTLSEKALRPKEGPKPVRTVPTPSWWVMPDEPRVFASRKEEGSAMAQRLVKEMLAARLKGTDFSRVDVARLYELFEEYGMSLPWELLGGSAFTRDALYRFAVEQALDALEASSRLALPQGTTDDAVRFVTVFSRGLSLPEDRAAVMVVSLVAKRLRDVLLQGAASLRSKEDQDALESLRAVANVLLTFPPEEDSVRAVYE